MCLGVGVGDGLFTSKVDLRSESGVCPGSRSYWRLDSKSPGRGLGPVFRGRTRLSLPFDLLFHGD